HDGCLGPKVEIVGDRDVDHARDVLPIEVADRRAQVTIALRGGLLRKYPNGAARAVTAEQRTLRPTQNLDALDVQHPHGGSIGTRHEHVVDIYPDTAAAADSPDLVVGGGVATAARTFDVQVRSNVRQVEHV